MPPRERLERLAVERAGTARPTTPGCRRARRRGRRRRSAAAWRRRRRRRRRSPDRCRRRRPVVGRRCGRRSAGASRSVPAGRRRRGHGPSSGSSCPAAAAGRAAASRPPARRSAPSTSTLAAMAGSRAPVGGSWRRAVRATLTPIAVRASTADAARRPSSSTISACWLVAHDDGEACARRRSRPRRRRPRPCRCRPGGGRPSARRTARRPRRRWRAASSSSCSSVAMPGIVRWVDRRAPSTPSPVPSSDDRRRVHVAQQLDHHADLDALAEDDRCGRPCAAGDRCPVEVEVDEAHLHRLLVVDAHVLEEADVDVGRRRPRCCESATSQPTIPAISGDGDERR